jgi:3',5'-cyclic AMP phosphodiesterase CpdA
MAHILHLSDLHLGEPGTAQEAGDYKIRVGVGGEQFRIDIYRSSMDALRARLEDEGTALAAVVVTGDTCLRGDATGFDMLPELLERLGLHLPPPEQILVLPGNHDVPRGSPPSSLERWRPFIDGVRGRGYVTPLLEGVDIDADGNIDASARPPVVSDPEGSFVVLAINTADLCMSLRDTGLSPGQLDELRRLAASGNDAVETLLDEHERLRNVDIARASKGQLIALGSLLDAQPDSPLPLRIAALHHQLLPVTDTEEMKDFEAIINLGQVRRFLATRGFSAVLHGHKHAPAAYVDRLALVPGEIPGPNYETRKILVSSGASLGQTWGEGQEFGRLIAVRPGGGSAAEIKVLGLRALAPGAASAGPLPLAAEAQFALTPVDRKVRVFEGATVDDVYDQLLLVHDNDDPESRLDWIICRIEEGATALSPPTHYPYPADVADDATKDNEEWFQGMVDWWQEAEPGSSDPNFTHGERIYRLGGDAIDQVESAAKALIGDPKTTRAVIAIVDPYQDDIGNTRHRMPAFCAVHVYFDEDGQRINCLGVFRKQQLTAWWPFNVAEIARIQSEVVGRIRDSSPHARAGSITTYASVTLMGTPRPRVIVPQMDRDAAKNPAGVMGIALGLFVNGADGLDEFLRYFNDWLPTTDVMEPDGVPVALPGLVLLERTVDELATRYDSGPGADLARHLHQMRLLNEGYSTSEDDPRERAQRRVDFDNWRDAVLDRWSDVESAARLVTEDMDRRKSAR